MCGFCWKPPGVFLLENSFSRWASFDAHTGSTARSGYTPSQSLLSPHPGVLLAFPFGLDSPFPIPGVPRSQGLEVLEVMAGSLTETALPWGSKRGSPAAANTHKVMGSPGAARCQEKPVRKGLVKAQLYPSTCPAKLLHKKGTKDP